MKRGILFALALLVAGVCLATVVGAQTVVPASKTKGKVHILPATMETTQWGWYDNAQKPVLTVNPGVPARTVQELIALVKANPGKYSFAQPATGSTPHLNGELLKLEFGLDLAMVPFNGAAPAITSTMGGHTPIAFTALPPAISNIKDGKLRALAVLSLKRVSTLPDVPTAAEAGIPGHEGDTLTGIVVPAGTPKPIIERLNAEIKRLIALPEVKDKLEALGFNSVANTPEEFAARIRTESARWAKVIRDANIKIE